MTSPSQGNSAGFLRSTLPTGCQVLSNFWANSPGGGGAGLYRVIYGPTLLVEAAPPCVESPWQPSNGQCDADVLRREVRARGNSRGVGARSWTAWPGELVRVAPSCRTVLYNSLQTES
jgi:hypothetical protein